MTKQHIAFYNVVLILLIALNEVNTAPGNKPPPATEAPPAAKQPLSAQKPDTAKKPEAAVPTIKKGTNPVVVKPPETGAKDKVIIGGDKPKVAKSGSQSQTAGKADPPAKDKATKTQQQKPQAGAAVPKGPSSKQRPAEKPPTNTGKNPSSGPTKPATQPKKVPPKDKPQTGGSLSPSKPADPKVPGDKPQTGKQSQTPKQKQAVPGDKPPAGKQSQTPKQKQTAVPGDKPHAGKQSQTPEQKQTAGKQSQTPKQKQAVAPPPTNEAKPTPRQRPRAKPIRKPTAAKPHVRAKAKETKAPKAVATGKKPPPINMKDTRGEKRKAEAANKPVIETATTVDGLPCKERFRPDPANPNGYRERTPDNTWLPANCAAPQLVWNQNRCRCDYPDDEPCGEFRKHPTDSGKYERLLNNVWHEETCSIFTDNLVWSQDKCRCDWDPNANARDKVPLYRQVGKPNVNLQCLYLLNITFDYNVTDYASNFWIDKQWNAHIIHSRIPGDVNGAAEIRDSPIKIEGFSGNDLTGILRVMFRFKIHPSRLNDDRYMVLISNGCRSWSGTLNRPSLAISFIPVNETFRINFNTTTKKIEKTTQAPADANGWYQVILFLQDQVVTLIVNGESILRVNGMAGTVVKSNCPLMIAGAPLKLDQHFDGYFDDLLVVKTCKYEDTKTTTTTTTT